MYKKIKIHNMNLKKYHLTHICLALDKLNKIHNKKTVILYIKNPEPVWLAPSKVIFLRKIKPQGVLIEILVVKFHKKESSCISCENHVTHHYNSEITSVSWEKHIHYQQKIDRQKTSNLNFLNYVLIKRNL
jgi:hypothetical protein